MALWKKARIPTAEERSVINSLERILKRWENLKKSKGRSSEIKLQNEGAFTEELDKLFNIKHQKAESLIKIEEDRLFLKDQETDRKATMGSVDLVLAGREKRTIQRSLLKAQKRRREHGEMEKIATVTELEDSSSSTDEDALPPKTRQMVAHSTTRSHLRNIITPALSAALDRTNTSNRNASYIVAATAASLGHDVSNLAVSYNTFRSSRSRHRSGTATSIMNEVATSGFGHCQQLVVHWDSKLLPALCGNEKVGRLAVLVSGKNIPRFGETSQLLGVPKIPASTGEEQANAVIKALKDWSLDERIVGMSFDTTSSNTGRWSGACVKIEAALDRDLLHFACRHHVAEILIGDIFKKTFGASSSPDVSLFSRFKEKWAFIERDAFQVGSTDPFVQDVLDRFPEHVTETLEFVLSALKESHARDDYKEFLELVLIFLGGSSSNVINFKTPGTTHMARWMAKILYVLKIWLFRGQFRLTFHEERALRDIALFASLVYVKYWFEVPEVVNAPVNDLQLLKAIGKYGVIHKGIADAASGAMIRHLWYLSDQLVALAFFSPRVSVEEKREMVVAMESNEGEEEPPKRRVGLDMTMIQRTRLADFCTKETLSFFKTARISSDFLQVDPKDWDRHPDYIQGKAFLDSISVVNDVAERAIKLIKDFNVSLTQQEEQKQFLLQVVAEHRRRNPKTTKQFLTK